MNIFPQILNINIHKYKCSPFINLSLYIKWCIQMIYIKWCAGIIIQPPKDLDRKKKLKISHKQFKKIIKHGREVHQSKHVSNMSLSRQLNYCHQFLVKRENHPSQCHDDICMIVFNIVTFLPHFLIFSSESGFLSHIKS